MKDINVFYRAFNAQVTGQAFFFNLGAIDSYLIAFIDCLRLVVWNLKSIKFFPWERF